MCLSWKIWMGQYLRRSNYHLSEMLFKFGLMYRSLDPIYFNNNDVVISEASIKFNLIKKLQILTFMN